VTEEHGSQDTLAGALARQLKERKIRAECFGTLLDGKTWEEDLRSALSQHGKTLEMIVCSDDDLAEDVLETAREAGREPGKDLLVLGAGAEEDLLKEILGGAAAGTVYYDSITESAAIAAAAVKLCALEVPDPLILDPVAVTNANAQEIRDYRNSFLK
jgi:methyl-galactoside transport system substrate-binding protein